jgi:hypothetical protein
MAVDQTTQAYIQAALRNQIAPSTLLWVWNGSTFVPWNAQIAGTVTTADASGVNMASVQATLVANHDLLNDIRTELRIQTEFLRALLRGETLESCDLDREYRSDPYYNAPS